MDSRKLIPCIKCNPQMWEYVKPILKDLGFTISWANDRPLDWLHYPYLSTNFCGSPTHVSFTASSNFRDLFMDVEDFLEATAKLIGKIYIKNYTMKKFTKEDIKPGMIVVTEGGSYLALSVRGGEIYLVREEGFLRLKDYAEDLTLPDVPSLFDIKEVRIPNQDATTIHRVLQDFRCSVVLWKRSEKKRVSFEEVAQKFGVDPSELEIETTKGSYLSK